jgi:hypothetical protein
MAGKWMVFDGAFNDDGASVSSSPIWMNVMVDSIVGDLKMAFVHKVRHRDEYDVYVVQRKECSYWMSNEPPITSDFSKLQ